MCETDTLIRLKYPLISLLFSRFIVNSMKYEKIVNILVFPEVFCLTSVNSPENPNKFVLRKRKIANIDILQA